MNALIAAILKERIRQFTYVDKLAAMVRRVSFEREGGLVILPVAADVEDAQACDDILQRAVIPDSSNSCMVYFEDRGCTPVRSRTRGIGWQSHLRLVCWLNTQRLDGDLLAGDRIAQQFSLAIKSGPYGSGPFIGIRHNIEGMPERGAGLFSAYSYPSGSRQYLLYPYDAFAIDIATDFRIKPGCEEEVLIGDLACITPPTGVIPAPPAGTCRNLKICGAPATGDVATWNGEEWVPQAPGGSLSLPFDSWSWDAVLGLLVVKDGVTYQVQLNKQ